MGFVPETIVESWSFSYEYDHLVVNCSPEAGLEPRCRCVPTVFQCESTTVAEAGQKAFFSDDLRGGVDR